MPSSDAREERSVVEDLASAVGNRAFSALVMQDAARATRFSSRPHPELRPGARQLGIRDERDVERLIEEARGR